MEKIKHTVVVSFFFLLAGCSVTGPRFQEAPSPGANSSLVYVYRPSSWRNASISPAIIIDGRERFLIKNGGYSFFYLRPGPHTFALELSEKYEGYARVELKTEAGRSYYVRVDTAIEVGIGLRKTFGIVGVREEIARDEIKDCNYVDPKKSLAEEN